MGTGILTSRKSVPWSVSGAVREVSVGIRLLPDGNCGITVAYTSAKRCCNKRDFRLRMRIDLKKGKSQNWKI
jgi:hypothetical protein